MEKLNREKQELLEKERAMTKLLGEMDTVKEALGTLRGRVAEHEAREVRMRSESA